MLEIGTEARPGSLRSSLLLENVKSGRQAMREKNRAEVVEKMYMGIDKSSAKLLVLAATAKSAKMADRGGDKRS